MPDGLKVLMFGWELPPFNSGGLGVACFGLTKALSNQNIDVTFVLPKELSLDLPFLRVVFAGAKAFAINSPLLPYINQHSSKRQYLYGSGLFEEVRRYALLAREIACKEDFDIIHAHDWLSFGAGIEAKEASGKPLVVHIHATEFDRTGGQHINPAVFAIEKEGITKADKVIAVSNFTKEKLVSCYGALPQEVEVIYNAIESPSLKPHSFGSPLAALKSQGKKIVIFVGRITLQKGPDYFLKAAHKVLEYNPHVLFVMAGAGDMEHQVIEEAASLGIADRVIFAGFLREDDLRSLYRSADLFVLSSVSEPFGITVLEALSNGAPVLISKQSGVSEVISHCLKVDFWDTDQMGAKIIAVLEHPQLALSLRENGLREVEKLTWDQAAKKCIQIYEQLLAPAT